MGNLIRNYRTQKKKLSFAQLPQQFGHLEDVFSLDLSNALTLLGDQFFASMAVKVLKKISESNKTNKIE